MRDEFDAFDATVPIRRGRASRVSKSSEDLVADGNSADGNETAGNETAGNADTGDPGTPDLTSRSVTSEEREPRLLSSQGVTELRPRVPVVYGARQARSGHNEGPVFESRRAVAFGSRASRAALPSVERREQRRNAAILASYGLVGLLSIAGLVIVASMAFQ